ncbi:FadR/GntR family transcriptional regulator [Myceligenerans pegani]|uniref:FadR family transcriptional regulator n=1 Tax=Myceligenerans pegani TaxID=2776917 RepID=A0ABR9N543_9MICO|nr:FCD domain-containing protein [Myceligenerans sp. TRM 65318]MBE1878301.1 FadR family transcriptional regulator [Myceligenerans sp. TRM 65318]MBE3020572.1 FadR family transcriptional regulator [Myceligenerans sp. TRM 65318]
MTAPSSLHAETVDRLLTAIQAGEFAVGSVLPPERVLAQNLEISRNTLREAIRTLDNAGVVQIRGRSGTLVLPAAVSSSTALRARAEATGDHSPLDLMIARLAVEPVCAEHAALQHTEEDAQRIRAALADQAEAVREGADPFEPDLLFHTAVAAASRNPALAALQAQLAQMMHSTLWTELKGQARDDLNGAERYLAHHEHIAHAILDRDPRRAGQLMTSHLTDIETALHSQAKRRSEAPSSQPAHER